MTNYFVGFPGLGIPEFTMKGVIFSIGGFAIHWYGVIIALGFLLAAIYVCRRAPRFNLTSDDVIDMLIFAVPAAIIGARLYYVVFEWERFKDNLADIFRIWDGGIAIYGAVIFAVIVCIVFCRAKHINAGAMLDLCAPGLLLGQAIGRWGNFVNVEVYGTVTELPWRMTVNGVGVHPLFLYESLWNILGFILLHLFSKKRKFNGQIILMYAAWYGLGRGILEGMRDDLYSLMVGPIRVSQLLGFASCLIALLLIGYVLVFRRPDAEAIGDWAEARKQWKLAKAGNAKSAGVNAPLSSGDMADGAPDRKGHREGSESAVPEPAADIPENAQESGEADGKE